jgi:hypothetical protein
MVIEMDDRKSKGYAFSQDGNVYAFKKSSRRCRYIPLVNTGSRYCRMNGTQLEIVALSLGEIPYIGYIPRNARFLEDYVADQWDAHDNKLPSWTSTASIDRREEWEDCCMICLESHVVGCSFASYACGHGVWGVP